MTKVLNGIAASDGIAAAKAYMLVQPDFQLLLVHYELICFVHFWKVKKHGHKHI